MATDLGVKVVNNGKYYFISYNTEDAPLVSKYLKAMDDAGLPVWYDYGIDVGDRWEEVIAEKILGCEAVIMFISSNIFKKKESFVHKEWTIAKRRKKNIYLIRLDEIDESKIPARYDFWWSDICSEQTLFAYELDFDVCVDRILQSVGYRRELVEEAPALSLVNDDFEIEEGVLKKYKGKDSVVKIPYGVTSIGEYAFSWCESLTEVVIPDSVTNIGKSAFYGCKLLTEVVIPDSVTSIGEGAFASCPLLTKIQVKPKNQYYMSKDGSLYSKDGKTIIQYATGKQDKSFTIPAGVTSIGGYAFGGCDSLTEVVIPNSVTSIGEKAFSWCKSLTEVVIPNSVTSIGECAFYSCDSLTEVVIPNSVTSIDEKAFYWCDSLTEVVIPNSVTSIGEKAFWNCENLKFIRYCGTAEEWAKVNKGDDFISSSCDIYAKIN